MDDVAKPTLQGTIKATAVVFGLLPQLAGLVVGLTAVAYVVGWRENTAFYNALGAPWAVSLLTTPQIMRSSIGVVSGIGLFFLLAVYLLTQGAVTSKSLRRWSIFFMGIAGALYISFLFTPPAVGLYLAAGISICWSWSTGLALGELVATLADNDLQWHAYHIYLLYFVATFGLIYVSDTMGAVHAKTILDSHGSKLALVATTNTTIKTSWRLVAPVDTKLLLVSFTQNDHKRVFILEQASNIASIESTTN